MTVIEAVIEDLRPLPIRRKGVLRKCEKYGVDPSVDAGTIPLPLLCRIEADLILQMLILSQIGEGGVNKSFDKSFARGLLNKICKEGGLDPNDFDERLVPSVTFVGDL